MANNVFSAKSGEDKSLAAFSENVFFQYISQVTNNSKKYGIFLYIYIDKEDKKMYNIHVRAMASSYDYQKCICIYGGLYVFVFCLEI